MVEQKSREMEITPTYLIEQLHELGLNKYEAQSYIDLLKNSPSTAREISRRTSVPQQRIYDVLEGLIERGLVLITHSKPRLYSASPPEQAVNLLLEKAKSIETTAKEVLYGLQDVHKQHLRKQFPEKTVWVIINKEDAQKKLREYIRGSSQSLLVIAGRNELINNYRYDLLSTRTRGVHTTILTNKTDSPIIQDLSPLELNADLPNIFIFDDRRLAWVVAEEFMVFSECPLCAYEVIKSCKMIVQTAIAKEPSRVLPKPPKN